MQEINRQGFDPWVGKIPWRRKWQPTSVLLPGESHRQRNLAGYNPWGRKERLSDWTELNWHKLLEPFFKVLLFLAYTSWDSIHLRSLSFPDGTSGKEPTCQCRKHKRCGFDPWSGRSPGVGNCTPSRILAARIPWTEEPPRLYSPWSRKN